MVLHCAQLPSVVILYKQAPSHNAQLFKTCPGIPPVGGTHIPPEHVAGLRQSLLIVHVVSQAVPVALQEYGAHLPQSIGMPHWKPPPGTAIQLPLESQLVVSSVPEHEVRHALASALQA